MAESGLRHIDVGPELTKTEWESEESHELIHGTSFPSSPVERQLFYRDDEHKWYIYNGTDWVWLGGGAGGGMEVHGNEYHDPDFEEEGVAATLVESHRTTEVHTQPQPPAIHANEAHDPDFATEAALAAHEADEAAHHSNILTITFVIDGGGSAITTGQKGHLEIPFACTIQQVTMLAAQSGSIVVDIWKDTYANFPPTDADSITASAPPTISSAQKSQDSTLTGWTTAIAAGDILAFNVDSCTTITRVTLSLKVGKS